MSHGSIANRSASAGGDRRGARRASKSGDQEERAQYQVNEVIRRQSPKFAGRFVSLKQRRYGRRGDEPQNA